MRTVTPLAPSAPALPPPGRSAPEAAAAPFAAVLDTHQARTAVAEGHSPKRPTGAQDPTRTKPATPDARAAASTKPATPGTPDAATAKSDAALTKPGAAPDDAQAGAPSAPTAPLTADPASVALAPVGAPVAAVPAAGAVPAPTATPSPVAPGTTPPVLPGPLAPGAFPLGPVVPGGPATAAPGAPAAGVAATAAATTQPAAPATADPSAVVAAQMPADATTQTPAPAPDAATTAALAAARQAGAGSGPGTGTGTGAGDPRQGADRDPAAAKRTVAPVAASALRAAAPAVAPGAEAGIAAAGTAAPAPTTTVAATAAAPAAPVASSAVSLQQAVETVRLTLGASAQRGVTRARIALRPEELGGVEVHLRHTAEGLSARVVAEAPEAARLLSQAAGELRRTLEQQGLNLVRIEVGTAGSDAAGTGTGAAGSDQRNGRRGPNGNASDLAGAETDLPIADRTIELPNGALVDVLA
jgi:flagellar hook-length control protein FliK